MRPLIIDTPARETVRCVVDFAERTENWYRLDVFDTVLKVPGNDLRYCCNLDTYRCVFSITKLPKGLYRHLSISIPSNHFPNPFAIYIIAELFGFTGWDGISEAIPKEWSVAINKDEHCIVLAYPYVEKIGAQ